MSSHEAIKADLMIFSGLKSTYLLLFFLILFSWIELKHFHADKVYGVLLGSRNNNNKKLFYILMCKTLAASFHPKDKDVKIRVFHCK